MPLSHLKATLDKFAPEKDSYIEYNYGARSLKGKLQNKLAFQKRFSLNIDRKMPLLLVVLPFLTHDGVSRVKEILPGILDMSIQIFFLKEDANDAGWLDSLCKRYHNQIVMHNGGVELLHEALAACDIFLAPAQLKRTGFGPMIALKYGTVPVMQINEDLPILDDYNPITEKGTAFLYKKDDSWLFFAALVRAVENFKLTFDWQRIQKNGMEVMG